MLANADRLLLFDLEWNPRGELTHRWFGGIHGLHADSEGVWVCCTNADLLAKMSWEGDIVMVWEWRRDSLLRETFGLKRLPPVNRELDYRDPETMRAGVPNVVHLNGVAPAPDGGILVSLGRILSPAGYRRAWVAGQVGAMVRWLGLPPLRSGRGRRVKGPVGSLSGSSSAIVSLSSGGQTEVLTQEKGIAVPNHNVWLEGRTLLYNDSNKGHLVVEDLDGDREKRRIPVPGASPFVRGLARLSATSFLVGGHGPAAIHRIDLKRGAVTQSVPIGDDPAEAVFGIRLHSAER